MTEIELKAHVDDRDSLIKRLGEIASFEKCIERDDSYWGNGEKGGRKIRIRRENSSCGGNDSGQVLVTYKRKELRETASGTCVEVNDEKECSVSDPAPLEAFLSDAGYSVVQKKHKSVMDWSMPLPSLPECSATLELCSVPPLGDFLEIEILCPDDRAENVKCAQDMLLEILDMTGIGRGKIEKRYYSEMLRELES